MSDPSRVRVTGPLEPYAVGFAAELLAVGYRPASAALLMGPVAHLSRWMDGEAIDAEALSLEVVDRFLAARRAAGYQHYLSRKALAPLLEYLRRLGVVVDAAGASGLDEVDVLLGRYRRYLVEERGLTVDAIRGYVQKVRPFVEGRVGVDGRLDLAGLTSADVLAFVLAESRRGSRGTAKLVVTGLRSLLRFLLVEGMIDQPLAQVVPSVAGWRLTGLPRGLEREQVQLLLASCDRSTVVGRRDLAILLMLMRLGMRRGEVAALNLDDLDWRAGEVLVRGKGDRVERLPLAVDVGEALVDYLRHGRPVRAGSRAAFLRVRPPHRRLLASGVGAVATSAAERAGLPPLSSSQPDDHRDLREGRPRPARRARAAVAGRCRMNALHESLADYLRIRRHLGYKLDRAERLLSGYLEHLETSGERLITTENALGWATLPSGRSVQWWAFRLSQVRCFARYLHALDPAHQVPPVDLLPRRTRRSTPYLYSDQEIVALLETTGTLKLPLQRATYRTLIALLSVTGMRVGEALRLERHDLDLRHGTLTVHESKYGKSRLLPLHSSTVHALRRYLRHRDQHPRAAGTDAVFMSTRGTRVDHSDVNRIFRKLLKRAEIGSRTASCRPRPHDLRHSFAVRTLLDWYRAGVDVPARLPLLSTYLGHTQPRDTYWYLQAAPELLALAAGRLEQSLEGRS